MIKQNTPEWLDLRKSKIGASDAPVILGQSKWKTAYELWEEKLGIRESQRSNAAMRRGIELEPIALAAYNKYTGNAACSAVVFHEDYHWMMASLDGLSLDRSVIVEIKCPGYKDHDIAARGEVPEHYYAQLQHQLATIGLDRLHYFSYSDESFHLVEVARDEKFIEDMILKELGFWDCMRNMTPPALSDRDYVRVDSADCLCDADMWRKASNDLAAAKEQERICREALINHANERNCLVGGVKVQKVVRQGNVNYKAIPELQNVNLSMYRNPQVSSWRITQ